MLRVLRHYLPLRRALLVFSETVLMTAVLGLGMTAHLKEPSIGVISILAAESMSADDAFYRCLFSGFLLAFLSQLLIFFNELYDFRISSSQVDRASRFIVSGASAVAVSLGAVLLARAWHLDRVLDFPGLSTSQLVQTLVFTMLIAFGVLYVWRQFFHFAMLRWHFNDRLLILGAGPMAQSLAAEIGERPDSGFDVVGLVPEAPYKRHSERRAREPLAHTAARRAEPPPPSTSPSPSPSAAEAPQAGAALLLEPLVLETAVAHEGAEDGTNGNGHDRKQRPLYDLVQRMRVDAVVVALEDRRDHLPTEELLHCRLTGITVLEREALYERITGKIAVEALRPSYLIFNPGFARSPQKELAKRALDVVFASLGLILTWPLMLATAIAVRLDSAGPILFTQERVGRDGRPFTLYKFRSMRADAEKQSGPVWATADDPRVTRCGRFLRKTRLDELPQLLNILGGSMSLVGPRPERPVFVEELSRQIPYYNQRHIVKPGLTGWAQINYPYGSTVEDALQKLQYDLFYIKNFSFLFDLSILFTTIKTVILRRGT
jgi:lipopolysaccharide/colanic/teichoic acid biosynthesis glycosyltransferase